MVLVEATEEEEEVHATDVIVDDGVVLPPCIAFAPLPLPVPADGAKVSRERMPLLWIAGLGLDSLWLVFRFPSLSSSSSAAVSAAAVAVVSECSGLNLGAHSSTCTGIHISQDSRGLEWVASGSLGINGAGIPFVSR
jgi:hypothetical protein